jgi:hypothetical protein
MRPNALVVVMDVLRAGPLPQPELFARCARRQIGRNRVEEAARHLGVVVEHKLWRLPVPSRMVVGPDGELGERIEPGSL